MPRLSVVLCYSPSDEQIARELAQFLERNIDCAVSLDEALIDAKRDLIDAAERGLSADAAIVLLSPASVPKIWKRERWEPILFNGDTDNPSPLGFALIRECKFPELLRRGAFFDFSKDRAHAAREARHWLTKREGVPARTTVQENLRLSIADTPGIAEAVPQDLARSFATTYRSDFESVHRIDCFGRSAAGILGDLGASTGVPLSGNVAENRESLAHECATHRWLFVLEGLSPEHREAVSFGGRTSVIICGNYVPSTPVSIEDLSAAFFAYPREDEQCAPLVGPATLRVSSLLVSDYESGLRLGWALLSVLKSLSRFAEMIEVLGVMERAARTRNDEMALFKIEWEQSWTSEESDSWGVRILPTAGQDTAQLSLFELAG